MKKHLFLSYRSTQLDFALKLAADLKNRGVRVWIDKFEIKPGDDWRGSVQHGIDEAAAMISILCPEYSQSDHCKNELARADRFKHPIYPIVIEPLAAKDWPFEVERKQYLDFTHWRDPLIYEQQFLALMEQLHQCFPDQIEPQPDGVTQYLNHFVAAAESRLSGSLRRTHLFENLLHNTFALASETTVEDFLQRFPRYLLLGSTVLLDYLALQTAHLALQGKTTYIPLQIDGATWEKGVPFHQVVQQAMPFEVARLSMYLDNLDADQAVAVCHWMEAHPTAHVAIGYRFEDAPKLLKKMLPVFKSKPLELDQIKAYLQHTLSAPQAHILLQVLSPDYLSLAGNVVFLPLLVSIWEKGTEPNPVVLIQHLLSQLWERYQHVHPSLNREEWEAALAQLAVVPHLTKESARKMVREECLQVGFAMNILTQTQRLVRFSLPLFQDYFAALSAEVFQEKLILYRLTLRPDSIQFERENPLLVLKCLPYGFTLTEAVISGLLKRWLEAPAFNAAESAGWLACIEPVHVYHTLLPLMRTGTWEVRQNAYLLIKLYRGLPILDLEEILKGLGDLPEAAADHFHDAEMVLPSLIWLLHHQDAEIRYRAAWVLGELHDLAAVPALVEALHDSDERVVVEAVYALGTLQDPTAFPLLLPLLARPYVQQIVANVFIWLGEAAIPTLRQGLTCRKIELRVRVVEILAEMRGQTAEEALLQASEDRQPDVRGAALEGFRNRENEKMLKKLFEALTDKTRLHKRNKRINEIAAEVLGTSDTTAQAARKRLQQITLQESVEIVEAELSQLIDIPLPPVEVEIFEPAEAEVSPETILQNLFKALRNAVWGEREQAAKAIRDYARLQRGHATEHLLSEFIAALKDPDWMLRWAAAEALAWLAHAKAVVPLLEGLQDSNHTVKAACIHALMEIGDPQCVEPLSGCLNDPDAMVREAVVEALGKLGDKRAVSALISAYEREDVFLRYAILEALRNIPEKKTPHFVLTALEDTDKHIRWAAVTLLHDRPDEQATQALITRLKDRDAPHWEKTTRICDLAAAALLKIGTDGAKKAVTDWKMTLPTEIKS